MSRITPRSSPQEDLAFLQTIRPPVRGGAGAFFVPGAAEGPEYRNALDEVLAKYGDMKNFQRAIDGGNSLSDVAAGSVTSSPMDEVVVSAPAVSRVPRPPLPALARPEPFEVPEPPIPQMVGMPGPEIRQGRDANPRMKDSALVGQLMKMTANAGFASAPPPMEEIVVSAPRIETPTRAPLPPLQRPEPFDAAESEPVQVASAETTATDANTDVLPEGFTLDEPQGGDALPPGFEIDQPQAAPPAPAPHLAPPNPSIIQPTLDDGTPGVPIDTTPVSGPAPAAPRERGYPAWQGAAKGFADIAGAPVDLTTGALNLGLAGLDLGAKGLRAGANYLTGDAFGDEPIQGPRFTGAPVGGSQNLADIAAAAAQKLGFPVADYESMPLGDKIAYRANEFGTSALAGSTALRGAALERAGNPARTPKFGDSIMKPYENGSLKPVVGDVGAGVGAGTAIGTYENYVPEEKRSPLAEFLLSILGGAGGGTATQIARSPKSIVNTIRDFLPEKNLPMLEDRPATAYDPAGKIPVTKGVADRAARYVQSEVGTEAPNVAGTLKQRAQWYKDRGIPVPTSGILSGDVGLAAIEQGDRVRNPVPYQKADQKIRSAASDELRSVVPPNAEPRAATEFAGREAKQKAAAANQAVTAAEQNSLAATAAEQATAAPYREPSNPQAASRALDTTVVEKTMQPRQQEKNAKFGAIPDAERDTAPLLKAVDDVRKTLGALNDPSRILPEGTLSRIEALAPTQKNVPGEPQTFKVDQMGVSERVAGKPQETVQTGGKVSFQDLNKLRPELTDAIAAARREGQYTLADNLKRLKREINAEADRMAAEGSPEAKDAVTYFKDEFAPYFGEGTVGGQLRKDINASTNRDAAPPSGTAERFLFTGAGSKEAASDLRKILSIAPDPASGNKAVRNYVLSDLAKTVDANGTIDPRRLKDWVTKRSEMLSEFPELQTEISKLQQDVVNSRSKSNVTAAELKKAVEGAKMTERDIQNGNLSLLLDSSPDVAVARVFSANDRQKAMRDVVKTLSKDKAASAGWKKAVSDYMVNKLTGTNTQMTEAGDAPAQFAQMSKFFRDHRQVLAEVYSPEEMNALQRAQKLLEPFGALSRRATAGSPTAENNSVAWRTLEAGLKAYFGVLKGGGVLRTVKLAASTVPNQDREVQLLVNRMAFDPDVAVHLLTRPLKEVDTPAWNTKLNRLLGLDAASRVETTDRKRD